METEKTQQTEAGETAGLPAEDPAEVQTEQTQPEIPQSGEKKPSWEEILADPEYRKRYDEAVGRTVQRRLRSRAEAEQRLSALEPVIRALREFDGGSLSLYPDPDSDQVVVSARSFGDANVQVIMEALGGGGNAAIAGAQISDKSVGTVLTELIASIDRYFESA